MTTCPSCTQHVRSLECQCSEACGWSQCCAAEADRAYDRTASHSIAPQANNSQVDIAQASAALDAQIQMLQFVRGDVGRRWLDGIAYGKASPEWVQGILSTLQFGETFYVTPLISEFLGQAAASTPNVTLREEMLPAQSGFVLFDKPLPMPLLSQDGYESINDDIAAFGWVTMFDVSQDDADNNPLTGIVLTSFSRPFGGGRSSPLRPVLSYAWHFGMTQADVDHAQAVHEATRNQGVPVEQEDRGEHWHMVRIRRTNYFIGLLSFLGQRILMAGHPQAASRATRKRAEADKGVQHDPVIRIIEYRRREYRQHEAPTDSETQHEYHVRWIVGAGTGGFWSHYHTKKGYEARWVLPFIKGNPAHPLKEPRSTINVVKR